MAGTWEHRYGNTYRLKYVKDGEPHRKPIKIEGGTKAQIRKALEIELAKFVEEVDSGGFIKPKNITFKAFVEEWKVFKKANVEPTTFEEYERKFRNHVIPYFGKRQLNKIAPVDIEKFYLHLRSDGIRKDGKKGGLSECSIKDYHALLFMIFKDAQVKWKILDYNIMMDVPAPKFKKKEAEVMQLDQVEKMMELLILEPLRNQLLILIPMFSMLRKGEITALDWNDVNYSNNTVRISKSQASTKEDGVFIKPTKNRKKRDTILPDDVISIFKKYEIEQKRYYLQMGHPWSGNNPIFIQDNFSRMHPDTPYKIWKEFIKKSELNDLTMHELRHTGASMLLEGGMDLENLSRMLGHASSKITSDIYTHVVSDGIKKAADIYKQIVPKSSRSQKS